MALIVIVIAEADDFDVVGVWENLTNYNEWLFNYQNKSNTIDINQTEPMGMEVNSKVQGPDLTDYGHKPPKTVPYFSIVPSIVVALSLVCVICVVLKFACLNDITFEGWVKVISFAISFVQ